MYIYIYTLRKRSDRQSGGEPVKIQCREQVGKLDHQISMCGGAGGGDDDDDDDEQDDDDDDDDDGDGHDDDDDDDDDDDVEWAQWNT